MNLSRFLKVLIFTSAFFICSAYGVYAQLSITPSTWNVIGLDSNRAATDGPNEFPVGIKVCNTSSSALSNLNTTFYWDSTNSLINLDRGGTTQSVTQSSIAANTCIDVYFTVVITRNTAAFNTSRMYHITSSATGASTVSTPTPREIYVEKFVSQNRNTVNSISGPTTVYVGQTYNYTVNGSTATNGYEQLEAFLNLSNVIFRVLSVNTTYSQPVGATNDKIYADSCGWDNNPLSATYRSCSISGKAGGTIKTVYTVLILSAGTTTASTLIYDFSGSSYHYNSDFGTSISSITITALPSVSISGNVFNDVDGLTDNSISTIGTSTAAAKTNAGGLFANLVGSDNKIVDSVAVAANGTYSFPRAEQGNYTIQISTNPGVVGSAPPQRVLPSGWVNTGEFLGTGAGNDGSSTPALRADGLLAVTVSTLNVSNANFGIEERPTANNRTAASQPNLGGTNDATVPPTTFSASDVSGGTVTGIRITAFPTNATSITIGGTKYTAATFPTVTGVFVTSATNGNTTQTILVDPFDGVLTVGIPYVSVDNAGMDSLPATASVPFTAAPTSAMVEISGTLYFGGTVLRNTLVGLTDPSANATVYTRTDRNGRYFFEREVGKTYTVSPLSSKYSFNPSTKVINLLGSVQDADFSSAAKNYRPKNDFDGDGKSDIAIFRPSNGNWYILSSSDNAMRVYPFGQDGDIPVSADFDGDGKTDIAVFRPSEGNWYIQQSGDGGFRAEYFGYGDDQLVPADYDGDGRADIAVYRNGFWYILKSSDRGFIATHFGAAEDVPVAEDFDGDGKTDLMVYRPSDGNWYLLGSQNDRFAAVGFGISTDIPVAGDYDGDGRADVAQFRSGNWYVLGSATGFEAVVLGSDSTKAIVGDYDGDGRADTAVFKDGIWFIRNSENGIVTETQFGLPTDILVK